MGTASPTGSVPGATAAAEALTGPPSRLRRAAGDTAVVAAAMTIANMLGYVLALAAARRLGPSDYGALAAQLALVLLGYVAALGLQTVTTRRVSTGQPPAGLVRLAAATALLTGLTVALLSWGLAAFLHLGTVWGVLGVAATLVPLTWLGFVQGVSQGAERFGLLAVVLLVHAVGKVGGGLAAVLGGLGVSAVLWATAAGTLCAAVVATLLVVRATGPLVAGSRGVGAGAAREVGHAVHALLALYVLTNIDLLLARHRLAAAAAGTYAVGAILTKVAFWFPQFVAVVALPRLADRERRAEAARAAVLAVLVLGIAVTAGTALLGRWVVDVVGGEDYVSLADAAWLFALLGSLFALAQLLLYDRLARRAGHTVAVLWVAVAAVAAAISLQAHPTVTSVVTAAVVVTAALVSVGLVVALRSSWREAVPRG